MNGLLNLAGNTQPSRLWSIIGGPIADPAGQPDIPCSVNFSPHHVHWAFQDMPIRHADKHFLIAGPTGAGKTSMIRLFLQSIAPRLQQGENEQIIIYDAKGDILPVLSGLGFDDEGPDIWIMNPFDARAGVWDIAEAMQSPALARYLGSILVPAEERSSAPFFWQAARELVWAVTIALTESRRAAWTFRDLICAFDNKEFVQRVCKRLGRSDLLSETIFSDDKHAPGVLTTILTKLGPFQTAASLWHTSRNPKNFSISEFLSKPGILVLGHDDTYKDSIKPINAMLMRALTDEILRRPNHSGPRHWFIFDEFPAMGKTDFARDLMNRGRSKGASVLMGFQSKEGVIDCYNENEAEEILGNCANKAFLRAGSPKTAQWMEQYFGNVRSTERSWGRVDSKDGTSFSENWATTDRPQFNSSFFSSLPFPEPGGVIKLVADGPGTGPLVASRQFNQVLSWLKPLGRAPGLIPRGDVSTQLLKPWDESEIELNCGHILREAEALPERRGRKSANAKGSTKSKRASSNKQAN